MKAADRLSQQLGSNIAESMGATRSGPAEGHVAFPGAMPVHGGPDKFKGAARARDAFAIEVGRIAPDPDQPRKEFDPGALADLAASLKARGQLQPIRVRWADDAGRWVIVAGERRYRAALAAGLPTLLCVEARAAMTPAEVLEDQLVENCLREDLKPIEQAHAFRALIDGRGCSYRQLAETLHISHQAVVRALALLGLPEDVQGRVTSGELAPSVAYEVSRLPDAESQRDAAERIISGGLTREGVASTVRRSAGAKGRGAGKGRKPTSRVMRTSAGKVTVENRRGIDASAVLAALAEAADQVRAQVEARGADAA